jgi:transcriptional regulator with XRE-family HTH domain
VIIKFVNYGRNMTNKQTEEVNKFHAEVGKRIGEAILIKGQSMVGVSEATGISYSSFRRSIRGARPLNVAELAKIANALDIPPHTLLPEDLAA